MLGRRIAAALSCAVTLLWSPGTAAADTSVPDTATPTASATAPPTTNAATPALPSTPTGRAPLMIVLDASGSMKLQDDYQPRMDVATSALHQLIGDLPADATVGLAVYGTNTGDNTSEKALGCTDVTVLRPVAPINTDMLNKAVDTVKASGYSPIGQALRTAVAQLPSTGQRTILLVSDGNDYCSPPEPCQVAKDLVAVNPGLTIDVLGVRSDSSARQELQCIADAAGGAYADTSDAQQLTDSLATGYRRPANAFQPTGTSLAGSSDPAADAPVLTPGEYLDDTLIRGSSDGSDGNKIGTVRYYRIPLGPAMTPWVSATIAGDVRSEDYHSVGLRVTLVNADDDACLPATDDDVSTGDSDPMPLVTVQNGGVAPGAAGWSKDCVAGAAVYLRVERLGEYRFGHPLPVEIDVHSEPPVRSIGPGPAAGGQPTLPPPASTAAVPATGGNNFADARNIKPSSTIADTIVAGETRFYAVPLSWGQRLTYSLSATGMGTPVGGFATAKVQLRNPLRTPVTADQQGQNGLFALRDSPAPLTGDSPVPVRYSNRRSNDNDIRGYAVAGTYYLLVSLSPSADDPGFTVPFTLTVATDGAEDTPTSYLAGVGSGETPATSTSSRPAAGSAQPPVITPAGTPGWVWALAGAGAALLLASAVTLVRRRPSDTARRQ